MARPATDPVAAGQQREADLAAIAAQIAAANPHAAQMNLPPGREDDGAP